jgi:hypothetical protein
MPTRKLTVEPGTRLLHVGPHKTGTTAIQGAFHGARERLAAHGVVYAGTGRHPQHAAAAITGARLGRGFGSPTPDHWKALCREVTDAGDRTVVISSEFFANADDAAAREVVDSLGGPRVHVVVTLRPLLKIMPSQWQQYVQNGLRLSYEEWLDGMLRKAPYDKPTPTFWRRHRHDALVERWAGMVGPERLTVIVVNSAEPLRQLRDFEALVGLPEGVLLPEQGTDNRSLTLGEVEFVRLLNKELRKRNWSADRYDNLVPMVLRRVRRGHTPTGDEPRIVTPAWAEALAAEVSKEMTDRISALGVRIVGDLSSLVIPPRADTEPVAKPMIPSAAAAEAVVGAILATQPPDASAPSTAPPPAAVEELPVRAVPATELLRVVGRRGAGRLRGAVRRRMR